MLDNHLYNLVNQLAQEHKSLWRIRDEYKKDSQSCVECSAFWKKMERDKTEHTKKLLGLIKRHTG